jgi:hypothetical protein
VAFLLSGDEKSVPFELSAHFFQPPDGALDHNTKIYFPENGIFYLPARVKMNWRRSHHNDFDAQWNLLALILREQIRF